MDNQLRFFNIKVLLLVLFLCTLQISNATTYYSDYGVSRSHTFNVVEGTHTFEVNGIAIFKVTEWYVDNAYKITQNSGLLAIDPDYSLYISGSNTIKAIVYNSDGIYKETHTWNVSVAKPDLIVQDINISPNPATAGETFSITTTLKNQGNAYASPFAISYYIDGSFIGEDVLSLDLNPGNSNDEKIEYTLPENLHGNHAISVFVDYKYEITESNENNNSREEIFNWLQPPLPDLIVQEINISPNPAIAGEAFTITATLKNRGNGNANPFTLTYFIDGSFIGEDVLSFGLNAGNSNDETIQYNVDTPGNHFIMVFVDSKYEITESVEYNNSREETFNWNGPDLIVPYIDISPNPATAGETFTITATLKNQGNAYAGPFAISYYIDGSSIGEDVLSLGLNPGNSNDETIQYTIPENTYGYHTISVFVDYKYEITENNENNNTREETYYWLNPKGSLNVTVNDQIGVRRSESRVILYTADWISINEREADGNGDVTWTDIDPGEYKLETYYNNEYWANGSAIVSKNNITTVTLKRNEPYEYEFAIYNSTTGLEITNSEISEGTLLEYRVKVRNQCPVDRSTKVLLKVARNQSGLPEFNEESSPFNLIKNDGNNTFIFNDSENGVGTYYGYGEVLTNVNGNYVLTDSWGWDMAFQIVSNFGGINSTEIPKVFALFQNYPNPFNPSTTIEFSIPKTGLVTLKIFDLLGQEVTTLVSEKLNAGNYHYTWDAGSLASGVYIYKMQTESGWAKTKKLVLLK